MTIEDIARVAHEVNRAYCTALGDNSQVAWEDAPQWQADSVIDGVRFRLENSEAEPSAGHVNWMARKLEDGWKFGPVKDAAKKEHPCVVPYDELPAEQRAKDSIFIGVVHALTPYLTER